jgi:hypothetical protein
MESGPRSNPSIRDCFAPLAKTSHTPFKGRAVCPAFHRLQADNSEGPSLLGQPTYIREMHLQKAATAGGLSRLRFYTPDSASENGPKPGAER